MPAMMQSAYARIGIGPSCQTAVRRAGDGGEVHGCTRYRRSGRVAAPGGRTVVVGISMTADAIGGPS